MRTYNFFDVKSYQNFYTGQSIYTIGNPNGFGLSFTAGVISSSSRLVISNDGSEIEAMQTSFVINEGNSGGPVFDKNGNLLGIISFRLRDKNGEIIQGVSFAIPNIPIKIFLSNL